MKRIIMLLSAAFLCTVSAMAAETVTVSAPAPQAGVAALPYTTVNPPKGEYWSGYVQLDGEYLSHSIVTMDYPGVQNEYTVYGTGNKFYITSYPDSNGFIVFNVNILKGSVTDIQQIYIYPTYQTK